MSETLRSDGKAVVVLLSSTKSKGDFTLVQGFHGTVMNDGVSGQEVALEIAQRVVEVNIGSLTGAKGEIIYMNGAGVLTNTNTDRPVLKVVKAKNAGNYVQALVLPQV